jgi:hypothetical protein
MAYVTGIISDGATILFQDVAINLQRLAGEITAYQGEFDIPQSGDHLVPATSLRFTCSDGRSGEIVIKTTHLGNGPGQRVRFQTNGPFE